MSHLEMPDTGSLNFDNQGLIYDSHHSTIDPTQSFYWLTSRLNSEEAGQPQDGTASNGFWNTQKRSLPNLEDGVDARINAEAVCEDGKHRVWSLGKDIADNGGNTTTAQGADHADVLIDNFRPYLSTVVVLQGGAPKYAAAWPLEPEGNTTLGEMRVDQCFPLDRDIPVTLRLTFSETMDTAFQPLVTVLVPCGALRVANGDWVSEGAGPGRVWVSEGIVLTA